MTQLGQRTKQPAAGTARRILDHARLAFNQRGVGAVGIREIARDLELSPGNVSYHFPTKEDLVVALVEEVHTANNAQVTIPADPFDFATIDTMIRAVMRRDLENQWMMRDMVSLVLAFPALRALHDRMQRAREARVDVSVDRLIDAGLLDRKRIDRDVLRQQVLTQIMFWVPSAILAAPTHDPARRLDFHARTVLALFIVFATRSGRRQLSTLLRRER